MDKFFAEVNSAVNDCILKNNGKRWDRLNVNVEIPKRIANGCSLTIWGEWDDIQEKCFEVQLYTGESLWCWETSVSSSWQSLAATVEKVLKQIPPDKRTAKRKIRAKYQKGRAITSLDELMCQKRVYFFDKVYSCGWFGSWQIAWAKAQIDRGRIYYAIPKEELNGGAEN